jgi:hypothetical protein
MVAIFFRCCSNLYQSYQFISIKLLFFLIFFRGGPFSQAMILVKNGSFW